MKTANTGSKLAFAKNAIVELNDDQLQDVNGGSIISVSVTVAVTTAMIAYLTA
ncbi:class I lanthipeptide [Flavobacterium inviolabile]|uniref:class I lanthipeptide n=1 Tax=Flavobacterium inviolabile TaxID=2748320 RepID=UPI0015B1697A|nr:class I lanthipeptide [Flavobacterium inviolabile]